MSTTDPVRLHLRPKRHLGRLRHRPRRDDLAGADDDKVRAPEVEVEVFRVVRLSDVKALPAPRVEKSSASSPQSPAAGVIYGIGPQGGS